MDESDLTRQIRVDAAKAAQVRELGIKRDKQSVPELLDGLTSLSLDLRLACADALGRINDCDSIGKLVLMLGSPDARTQESAARALGCMGAEAAVEPLLKVLDTAGGNRDKHVFVKALAAIGGSRALSYIAPYLEDETGDEYTRLAVAAAFGKSCDPKWLEQLTAIARRPGAQHSDLKYLRSACVTAMAQCGGTGVIPYLIDCLLCSTETTQKAAMEGFVAIGKPAVESLVGLLNPDGWDDGVKWAMAHHGLKYLLEALGKIDDARAFSRVLAVVQARWDTTDVFRHMISPKVLDSIPIIERWLKRDIASISSEDLRNVILLKDRYEVITQWHDDGACYSTRSIDCLELRRLAMDEVSRRAASS